MPRFVLLASLLLAGAATAQDMPAVARVEVRSQMPVSSACPDVFTRLPQALADAWRDVDQPSLMLVEFRLDGERISHIKISGGHGDYFNPVRQAVKKMACSANGAYAVRFRIEFAYPSAQRSMAMQLSDATPAQLAQR